MQTSQKILLLGILALLACLPAAGDVFNLKVLSDNAPDLTDIKSFANSVGARWKTNDEKCLALVYWFSTLGNQSSPPYEWMPVEPILHFNTSMQAQCAYWTGLYCAVAEGGFGWVGRHYEVGDHTVPEIEFDGKRVYIDNTYKFSAARCDGKLIGIMDMDDVAGPCDRGPRCRFHNLLYHTPQRLCDDLDGYKRDKNGHDSSRIKAWLSGPWLRRDSAGRAYFAETLDEKWVKRCWKQMCTGSCHSIYRMRLNLRDNEYYTRFWEAQGASTDYYYPSSSKKDPDSGIRDRGRGNGEWVYTPDLSDKAACESSQGIKHSANGITPSGGEGQIVFKIQSHNVTTGCFIKADIGRKSAGDSVVIEVSANGGRSWAAVWDNKATGAVTVDENASDRLKGTLKDNNLRIILNYLVRVRLKGSKASLKNIAIRTLTGLNRNSLPKLDIGRNYITVNYDKDRQVDTLSFRPNLGNGQYQKDAVEHANLASQKKQTSWSATLYANNKSQEGFVTYELSAPRPITRIRMGGDLWLTDGGNQVRYLYRCYDGSWGSWKEAGKFDWGTRNTYHRRRNQCHYVEKPANGTKVQFKFAFRSPSAHTNGAGASLLRMEIDYQPAKPGFKPLEVTYAWMEYFEPLGADDTKGTLRTHTERITSLPHSYFINTGGDIRPLTKWVRVNLTGSAPQAVKTGYSDGKDVGDKYEIPSFKYTWGKLLSLNKKYTTSIKPSSDSLRANGDDQELTDGAVKEPQVEGPSPDRCLASFSGSVDITVDLGEVKKIGGARVDAFRGYGARFPDAVSAETSKDGSAFKAQARDKHKSAKYAHNGWPATWPKHPRHDAKRYGPFPDYGLLGNYIFLLFDKPIEARFVRFRVLAGKAGKVALSEVHVYDTLKAEPFTWKLAHEPDEEALAGGNKPSAGPVSPKSAKTSRKPKSNANEKRAAVYWDMAQEMLNMGQPDAAKAQLKQILKLYPDTTYAVKAKAKLKDL